MDYPYTKRIVFYIFFISCLTAGGIYYVFRQHAENEKTYKIVVVQSYATDCTWKDALNAGIRNAFTENAVKTNIRTFYLDCENLLALKETDTLRLLLDEYKEEAPDLIIACDDAATFSLIQTRHPLTYTTPIVFCGVDYVNKDILPGHTNITGFSTQPDFIACYRLAARLLGKINNILLITENSYLGKVYTQDACRQFSTLPEIKEIEFSEQDNEQNIFFPGHAGLKSDSVIVNVKRIDKMSGLAMKWNLYAKPRQFAVIPKWSPLYSQFPRMSNLPFFTVNNEGYGNGSIGGYITTSYDQGYEAAERGIKILKGAPPADFPVTPSKKTPVFDWDELQRWNIAPSALPAGAIIPNMPFFERYKKRIIAAGAAGLICILISLVWLMRLYKRERRNKRRIQKKLVKEQKELSITMESINEGVISINRAGLIISINRAALAWLHLENDTKKYIGYPLRNLFNIISGTQADYLDQMLESVWQSKEKLSFSEDAYLVTTDNLTFPVSGAISNIPDNEKLAGVVITFRDITEKQVQREFLALSMLAGDIFAWRYDEITGKIIFDEAFFRFIETTVPPEKGFDGEKFMQMLHPDDAVKCKKTVSLIERGKIAKSTLPLRIRFENGKYEWWEFRMASMPESSLKGHYKLFGICLDIEEYKKTEQELIHLRDEALESDRKKSIFMANMSHEIRTPLNAIVGFSTLLTDTAHFNPAERKVFIETINENCTLLLNLINEILDISRIESGIQFKYETCNLNALVTELETTYRKQLNEKTAWITCIPPVPVWHKTDPLRLKQLLSNLIGNAIKFTDEGSITVGYSYDKEKETLLFTVSDTGIGISGEEQSKIFDRFYKTNDFVQGGGLGLSICKEIIKRMEGSIRMESKEGKGTSFYVTLPYHRPDTNHEER